MSSVLFEEIKTPGNQCVAIATLNSPSTLNSLSLEMVRALKKQLDVWEKNPSIVLIFVQGAGEKAFCAGGDIVRLYDLMKANDFQIAENFFQEEYQLDYTIHTFPKPIMVWGHGIVMGGGMGLFAGAQFRIATETSKFAMPEVSIGFFPDVGGSYFLSRMPHQIGLFLALTATRLNGQDAVDLGLASSITQNDQKSNFLRQLQETSFSGNQVADSTLIKKIVQALPRPSLEGELLKRAELIEAALKGTTIEEIEGSLIAQAEKDEWFKKAFQTFKKGSPSSLAFTLEQLKRGLQWNLKETFENELIIASQFIRHHDLSEGIRALLIDKDGSPQWKPKSPISRSHVELYFRKV